MSDGWEETRLGGFFVACDLTARDGGNAGFAGAKTGPGGNPSGCRKRRQKSFPTIFCCLRFL
jgi:hypothetical protein